MEVRALIDGLVLLTHEPCKSKAIRGLVFCKFLKGPWPFHNVRLQVEFLSADSDRSSVAPHVWLRLACLWVFATLQLRVRQLGAREPQVTRKLLRRTPMNGRQPCHWARAPQAIATARQRQLGVSGASKAGTNRQFGDLPGVRRLTPGLSV